MLVFVMALGLVGQIIINKISINIKIRFRKTRGDLSVKMTEINHKQRARQDQTPAHFTRL